MLRNLRFAATETCLPADLSAKASLSAIAIRRRLIAMEAQLSWAREGNYFVLKERE
jgi:hypothetical protein